MKDLTPSEIAAALKSAATAIAPFTKGEYSVRLQVGENLYAEMYGNVLLPESSSTRVYSLNEDAEELTHKVDLNFQTNIFPASIL